MALSRCPAPASPTQSIARGCDLRCNQPATLEKESYSSREDEPSEDACEWASSDMAEEDNRSSESLHLRDAQVPESGRHSARGGDFQPTQKHRMAGRRLSHRALHHSIRRRVNCLHVPSGSLMCYARSRRCRPPTENIPSQLRTV